MATPTFLFVSDHPALDLVNTVTGVGREAVDLLDSPAAASAWFVEAGMASEHLLRAVAMSPPLARRLLDETIRLRAAIRALIDARARRTYLPEPAVFALNRILAEREVRLVAEHQGVTLSLREASTESLPLGSLATVAAAAARLLSEVDPARLRQCARAGCGLWFHDVSRNGRRRWCSMALCGNRMKVQAHYRRSREQR